MGFLETQEIHFLYLANLCSTDLLIILIKNGRYLYMPGRFVDLHVHARLLPIPKSQRKTPLDCCWCARLENV